MPSADVARDGQASRRGVVNFFSKVLYGERQGYNENDLQPVGGCDTDVGNACFRPSTKRLLREAAHD
jgi:hypothetical protein